MKGINQARAMGVAIGVICLGSARCMAADTDTIDTVSSDGEIIIMQSGQTYRSDDPGTSSSWQAGDDVTITNDDTIVNTDEGGDSVEGTEE